MNGWSHGAILREAAALTRQIEAAGVLSAVTDESCLMSHRAGMTPREFRDASRLAFFAGDAERAADLVARINANV
jgi:hypothetical protein